MRDLCRTIRAQLATIAASNVAVDTPLRHLGTKETAFRPLASLGMLEQRRTLRRHENRRELGPLAKTCDNFVAAAPLNLLGPLLRIYEKTVHLP